MNKKLIWIGAAIAVIGICGYLYNQNNEEFKLITNETEMTKFVMNHSQEELDDYYKKVDELKANDTHGGETPGETLALYIGALEVGDMELASKYFRLEDQENELSLYKSASEEDIANFIDVLKKSRISSYNESLDSHELRVEDEGDDLLMADFIKIEQSGLWKLKSI